MLTLSKKYSISDRGLSKACAASNIPVPERGYWNKLKVGKKVLKRPLSPRGLGQTDSVTIGASRYGYYGYSNVDYLNEPIPPPPVFETEMETVRAQVTSMVNKAPLPKTYAQRRHPQIARLLAEDEERLQKQQASKYSSYSDAQVFNTPFETRRLRILNGLFICLQSCCMKPSVSGKEGRDLSVLVGDRSVGFSLDSAGAGKQLERERMGYGFQSRTNGDRMSLSLSSWRSSQSSGRSWQDEDGVRLESHLREIAIELIVSGEQNYRDGLIHHREWLIKHKAELQEEERKRKLEEERKRRERQAKLEQARVRHLLAQADAMHQAGQIRAYVAAIQEANKTAPQPMSADELHAWTHWAMSQADRIDPVLSGAFKTRPSEPEE
jgi:hypothetical protein